MENEQTHLQPTPPPYNYVIQGALPNATAVLILGILSIVSCFCYGVVGVILSVIALILASNDLSKYRLNPTQYSQSSLSNLKAGKVCAIIGLSLSALYIIGIVFVLLLGIAGTLPFDNF